MRAARVWLFLSSCVVLAMVAGWLMLVVRFQPEELQPMLNAS